MDIYDVYVFCDECNDSHNMSFCISLDDGPAEKESIENLYAGKEVPSYFATLLKNKVQCPNTQRMFLRKDNNQIFLVSVSD